MKPTSGRSSKRLRYGTAAAAVVALGVVSACSSSGSSTASSTSSAGASASASSSVGSSGTTLSFPRTETLYTSGTAYGPAVNWNPLDPSAMATGTQGLIYEPLYLYDPVKGQYDSWLSSTPETSAWQDNNTKFVFTVRSGVTWSNGTAMTAADVVFSMQTAMKDTTDPFNPNVASVASVSASGNTVTVTFKDNKPGYTEFNDYLWKAPVLPEALWKNIPASQINTYTNTHPVGTGPMTLDTANAQEVAYETRPSGWWATAALGYSFKFKYLVDVVNGSNSQELGQLTAGNIDWSNNYLPGINSLAQAQGGAGGYTLKFYYPQSQNYMLSGNTVWLEPNESKFPGNNLDFRKALADALDPSAIAQQVYGGIATPANPTGLLPTLLNTYVNPNDSVLKPLENTNNLAAAKTLLAESGYKGQTLKLEAPQGWSDWNSAQTVMAQELKAAGINVTVYQPTSNQRTADMNSGNYDLILDNNAGLDTTPWSYFQRVYQLPVASNDTSQMNIERSDYPADWTLVQQLATVPATDTSVITADYQKLESDFLKNQVEIPLWYNGIWFQGNTQYWTDFPSSSSTSDQNIPAMWGGYIGAMTTVPALAQLEPAKPAA